jgi:hypothetical protein
MRLIRKSTKNDKTIREAFKAGDTAKWNVSSFDGRITEILEFTGTVVKVNRKTVDVERDNGDVYRLDAFIKVSTGQWALA